MLQYVIVGLVFGSIYALAASGLVITYVSTGMLNFAFGAIAYFVARLYYYLNIEHGWGHPAGRRRVPVRPAPRPSGSSCTLVLFRHLRLSSPLIKIVVTIGVSVALPPVADDRLRERTAVPRRPASRPSR